MSGSEEEISGEEESTASEGDPFNPKHELTDVVCAVIFVVAVCAFIVIFLVGFFTGNTDQFTRGIDVNGQLCGISDPVRNDPYLYYCPQDIIYGATEVVINTSYPVCLPKCPTGVINLTTNDTEVHPPTVAACAAGVSDTYITQEVANRYCAPSAYYTAAQQQVEEQAQDVMDTVSAGIADILKFWWVLLIVLVVATALGYVYLWLLRATARLIIPICVGVAFLCLAASGYYLWTNADSLLDYGSEDISDEEKGMRAFGKHGIRIVAVLLWVLAGVVAFLGCCCGRSIATSTACVQTGALVIFKMPLMLLSPLVKAVVKFLLMLFIVWGFWHLWAMGDVTGLGLHKSVSHTPEQWITILIYVFVGFWILAFTSALYEFSVAYSVVQYYYAQEDEDGEREIEHAAVLKGATVGIVKHMGSLAYGAAVIAVLHMIESFLQYVKRKYDEIGEDTNKCVKCCLTSCICCVNCFEKCIQFVNKNAYIDIAVKGNIGFCQAVKNVAHILIDFAPAMAILNGATVIFQIVGIAAIMALCGLLAFWLTSLVGATSPIAVVLVACLLSGFIAWAFMDIFDVTTDTLLICYAEDQRSHNNEAVYAPADMKKLYKQAEELAKKQTPKTPTEKK